MVLIDFSTFYFRLLIILNLIYYYLSLLCHAYIPVPSCFTTLHPLMKIEAAIQPPSSLLSR